MTVGAPCQLPYPERYDRALEFYNNWPQQAKQPRQDTQLILWGLSAQVAHGPCDEPQPSGWNQTESAKWTAWTSLKNMDRMEAMRLFVKTLEEDEPTWFAISEAASPTAAAARAAAGHALAAVPCDGTWASPWVAGDKQPYPRFEHSCCLLGNMVYLFGGNCAGGRYLSDVWELNLESLVWADVTATFSVASDVDDPVPAPFPATAAAVALPHRGRALLIGGHVKTKDPAAPLAVRVLDTARRSWSVLHCGGDVPRTRGSHAACIISDKVYVLGGESPNRRLQQGVQVLELSTNTWAPLAVEGPVAGPPASSALAVTAFRDRYIVVFGGGAVGNCNNDLWYFDTSSATWHQPPITGAQPAARAGCAAALLGNRWYIFGGGNNTAGCPDMWVMDLLQLGRGSCEWQRCCTFDRSSSLASEGSSVVAVPAIGALVAFGGYNGTYHNSVSVYRPDDVATVERTDSPAERSAPREPEIQPATPRGQSAPPPEAKPQSEVERLDAAQRATSAALEDAAMVKEAMGQEIALLQNQLSAAQAAQAHAEAEAEELRAALAAEKDRAFKAEVEMSELQSKLQTMDDLERELHACKEANGKKSSGGIWGYISGA